MSNKIVLCNGQEMTDPGQLDALIEEHPAKVNRMLRQDDLIQSLRALVQDFETDYDFLLDEDVNLALILYDFAELIGLDAEQMRIVFGDDIDLIEAELNTGYKPLETVTA